MVGIFRIILKKGFYLLNRYELSTRGQKACEQQIFQQSFEHVGNLEALEIHASNMIQHALNGKNPAIPEQ